MTTIQNLLGPALLLAALALAGCSSTVNSSLTDEPTRGSSSLLSTTLGTATTLTTTTVNTVTAPVASVLPAPRASVAILRTLFGSSAKIAADAPVAQVILTYASGKVDLNGLNGNSLTVSINPRDTLVGIEVILKDGGKWYFDGLGRALPADAKWYTDVD